MGVVTSIGGLAPAFLATGKTQRVLDWGPRKVFESLSNARGKFLTLPWGRNLTPRGDIGPCGWRLSVRPTILLNSVYPWEGWSKGWTFPLGNKVHPWGPSSPLGANFLPRGKLLLLKTDLWPFWQHCCKSWKKYKNLQRVSLTQRTVRMRFIKEGFNVELISTITCLLVSVMWWLVVNKSSFNSFRRRHFLRSDSVQRFAAKNIEAVASKICLTLEPSVSTYIHTFIGTYIHTYIHTLVHIYICPYSCSLALEHNRSIF
jgi:hypothetical protein